MTPQILPLVSEGEPRPFDLVQLPARLGIDAAGNVIAAPDAASFEISQEGAVWIVKQVGDAEILVNGIGRLESVIQSRDLLQVGRGGPRFVFRSGADDRRHTKTVSRIFSDSMAHARSGATTKMRMAMGLGKEFIAESVAHGTRTLRIALSLLVVALIAGVTFLVLHLAQRDRELREAEEKTKLELQSLEGAITNRMQSLDAKLAGIDLRSENLEQSRLKLEETLAIATKEDEAREQRLKALEGRSESVRKFVAKSRGAVGFIFGVQGWKDPRTKLPVRVKLVFPGGPPARGPRGEIRMTVQGSGPPVRNTYFGTAFLIREDGTMVTNRHVVQPWYGNKKSEALLDQGFAPVVHSLVAYFPGEAEGLPVEQLSVSRQVDVALIRVDLGERKIAPFALAPPKETPEVGSPVVLLGYPAGIAGLVVKLANRKREELLRGSGEPDFEQMIKELASIQAVKPTITSGLLSNALEEKLVYDAATTSGGSGGPVCDLNGRVIGVNYAIFEQFAGANFGVPIRFVHALLAKLPQGG